MENLETLDVVQTDGLDYSIDQLDDVGFDPVLDASFDDSDEGEVLVLDETILDGEEITRKETVH